MSDQDFDLQKMQEKSYQFMLDTTEQNVAEMRQWLFNDPSRSALTIILRDGSWQVELHDDHAVLAIGTGRFFGEAVVMAMKGLPA